MNQLSDDSIEFVNIEVFKITDKELSYLYYPSLKIMNVEYYDSLEDDDFITTIYYEGEFHLDDSPEKDEIKLKKYLDIFKEYENACS